MEDDRSDAGACSRPPALDDLTLIIAMDGDADVDVLAHLRACTYCTRRAREFADLHGLLSKRLYRVLCPSSDELVAYQQGWLRNGQRVALRDHLRDCPHCAADLRLLVEAADVPLIAPQPRMQTLRRVIAQLLEPPSLSPLGPVYGAMRGSAPGGQYVYRAENIEIMLDVERATGHSGRLVLFGALLRGDSPKDLNSASASLLCDDAIVSSAMLDELGNFMLDDITPGDYSLSLRLPDCEVVVEALSL